MSDQVAVPLLLLLEPRQVLVPPRELQKRHQKRKKRRKVRIIESLPGCSSLTAYTEKEESDEDMGFGLFD